MKFKIINVRVLSPVFPVIIMSVVAVFYRIPAEMVIPGFATVATLPITIRELRILIKLITGKSTRKRPIPARLHFHCYI